MEWLQPQPASIAPLAEFMFSLVITLYLLSIPKKSKDAWLITGHYSFFTLPYMAAFINTATLQVSWHPKAEEIQFLILAIVTTYNLWFAYMFRQSFFRSERFVVGTVGILYAITITAGKSAIVWTFPIFLFAPFWMMILFFRKAIQVSTTSMSDSG
jgi:hypothetical protein